MATQILPPAPIDLRRELRGLYSSSAATISVLDVPRLKFLMVDGHGTGGASLALADAANALFQLSRVLGSTLRWSLGVVYRPMPLEALYDTAPPADGASSLRPWTLMIMQPDAVTPVLLNGARAAAARHRSLPALDAVRLDELHEGLSVQILQLGEQPGEAATLARLHTFLAEHGYRARGRHHLVYLDDPRRTPPETIRTVVRQPIDTTLGQPI